MNIYRSCLSALTAIAVAVVLCQAALAAPVELTLDDSIAMAMKNNYDIKYANSSREKSYWALKQAEKSKGVSLTFTHIDERYKPTSLYYSSTYTNYFDNELALTLPLYSGGKLDDQIEQAKLDLKVADLDIAAAAQQLKQTVVADYFTVLEYRNEVQVDQETVRNYEDHLNLVNAKFAVGLVAKTDVLSSQVNLATAQDTLIKAQNNYNNAVATLNNAIGLPHGTELNLKDEFTYETYPLSLEQCLEQAIANRPEIAQYQAKVASAEYDVKIAKSGYLPTVNLTAAQDWNDAHLLGTDNSNYLVELTTSLNVFDTGLTDSKVKQAQHNVDMTKDKAAQERDTILLDVRQYYLSMHEAEKRMDTTKVSVNQAEENLMIAKAQYDVGVCTNLDLLDDVLSLASAKKNYIQALYDYNTNKAQLERAIGRPVE